MRANIGQHFSALIFCFASPSTRDSASEQGLHYCRCAVLQGEEFVSDSDMWIRVFHHFFKQRHTEPKVLFVYQDLNPEF